MPSFLFCGPLFRLFLDMGEGKSMLVDVVVLCIGVRPASAIAKDAGVFFRFILVVCAGMSLS